MGLEGWVVIDSTVRGSSSGGLRVTPTVSEEELRHLARTMTRKYGFLGFPKGGAKAGFRADPDADPERLRLLLGRFGQGIRPLLETGRYWPGPDMGTNDERIHHVLGESGVRWREAGRWKLTDSGRFTAAGMVGALVAAGRRLGVSEGKLTVSVEGLGSVGLAAARLLAARGIRVVAMANRYGRIHVPQGFAPAQWDAWLADAGPAGIDRFPGSRALSQEEFLELDVHAFLPCAQSHTLTEENADGLRARCLVPGANNPATEAAQSTLEARGVLMLPDFVTNAGGVLGGALEFGGLSPDRVVLLVQSMIGDAMESLLAEADAVGRTPFVVAEETARARFRGMTKGGEPRLAPAALFLRKRGAIPAWLARRLTELFARRLGGRLVDFGRQA